jgi:hypothetical protein
VIAYISASFTREASSPSRAPKRSSEIVCTFGIEYCRSPIAQGVFEDLGEFDYVPTTRENNRV